MGVGRGLDPTIEATTSSFKVRLGGDRVGKVADRLMVFMGPGLEYWSGKGKLDVGGAESETENVSRIGVSGRIGGFMMVSEEVGMLSRFLRNLRSLRQRWVADLSLKLDNFPPSSLAGLVRFGCGKVFSKRWSVQRLEEAVGFRLR